MHLRQVAGRGLRPLYWAEAMDVVSAGVAPGQVAGRASLGGLFFAGEAGPWGKAAASGALGGRFALPGGEKTEKNP